MVQIPLPRHRYTKWTPERVRDITRMWNAGRRVADIAAALGATPKAIYKKIWMMRHAQTQDVTKRRAGRPRKEQT